MSALRRCRKCWEEKPLSEFNVAKRNPDGSVRTHRANCRQCKQDYERVRRGRTSPVDTEKVPPLPIGPWRKWLLAQLEEHEGKNMALAKFLGVDESLVRRWINGEKHDVRLDTADKALCRIGKPWLLRELWPELYVFEQETLEYHDDIA